MTLRKITLVVFVSIFSALIALGIQNKLQLSNNSQIEDEKIPAQLASFIPEFQNAHDRVYEALNFVPAANISTPCVVHIKTIYTTRSMQQNPFQDLFGNDFFQFFGHPQQPQRTQKQEASGSGVIVSPDGYIVTNNHVVQDADEIEVILNNKKTFKAKLVGTDKDTDLGVIKIEANDLQSIYFANSDSVQVGEWVLAVGNPFNLASTVTAGIVSAKGRNINILNNQRTNGSNSAIESFIQTDAAVNPGNSGGALVNIRGQLIGINTAIASPTGAYAGYSFAVPSNLVKKVIEDLKKFGVVQRGYLGVNITGVNDEIAKKMNLRTLDGVYVDNVIKGSAGENAGIKEKDIILKVNGVAVNSAPELQEQIGKYRPGDKIDVELLRDGNRLTLNPVLKNVSGNTQLVSIDKDVFKKLGIDLSTVTANELRSLNLSAGLKVMKVNEGLIKNYTDLKPGFIITSVQDKSIGTIEDFQKIIQATTKGTVILEGIYPGRPFTYQYAFKI